MKPRILVVDNVPEFLEVQARLLRQEEYEVSTASQVEEAETLLEKEWFHLAIIDQRMGDENNEHDIGGLLLARQERFRNIPKIILTAYPDYESAVGALGSADGYSSAFDYVAKQKGPQALSDAVKRVLFHKNIVNWRLEVIWKRPDVFSVVSFIEPNVNRDWLGKRAEELEYMFHEMFHDKEQIRVERLLWHRKGRVALVVLAFRDDVKPEAFVVVCGQNSVVREEARRFAEFGPKVLTYTGTMLNLRAETTHFAANTYAIAKNDLEKIPSLYDSYQFASERQFTEVLTALYQNTLPGWHQDKLIVERLHSLEALYCQRLGLLEEHLPRIDFEGRIGLIENQIPTIGATIEQTDDLLRFRFNNQSASFPNPLLLFSQTQKSEDKVLTMIVPGVLSGESILVDESRHVWLTDFAEAGTAPLFWNHVSLEAEIRFDWLETNDLLRRYELEHCLLNTDFAKPDTRDLESVVRDPARAILIIRKLAAQLVGNNSMAYHQGIFFHAARRLADFDRANRLTANELARLGHILLSMAMITAK
jgi:CheY-like chemotaxis protein